MVLWRAKCKHFSVGWQKLKCAKLCYMFYFLTVITNLWTSLEFVLDKDGNIYIVWILMHPVDQEYWFCSAHFWVVKKHISWSTFFLVWRSRLPGSWCVWLEIGQCHICHVTAGVTMGRWCFGTPGLWPAYVRQLDLQSVIVSFDSIH